jgi:hypothetical protein
MRARGLSGPATRRRLSPTRVKVPALKTLLELHLLCERWG